MQSLVANAVSSVLPRIEGSGRLGKAHWRLVGAPTPLLGNEAAGMFLGAQAEAEMTYGDNMKVGLRSFVRCFTCRAAVVTQKDMMHLRMSYLHPGETHCHPLLSWPHLEKESEGHVAEHRTVVSCTCNRCLVGLRGLSVWRGGCRLR